MHTTKRVPGIVPTISADTYVYKHDHVKTQCAERTRTLLLDLFRPVKNGIFVEIGVFGGANLLHLHQCAVQNGSHLYGIDPFENIRLFNGSDASGMESLAARRRLYFQALHETLDRIMTKYALRDTITLIVDESARAQEAFSDNSIDLLHIDGDHSEEAVYQDLTLYWPKMRHGGVIIGDDYAWMSVRAAVSRFCAQHGLTVTPLFLGAKYKLIK